MASLIMSSLTSHWRQTFDFVNKCHWMNERAPPNRPYTPTTVEHIANVITHGLWIPPSIWGAVSLVQRSTNWQQFWSGIIYSGSLILLFTISTIFHCVFFCHGHGYCKSRAKQANRVNQALPWFALHTLNMGLLWLSSSRALIMLMLAPGRYFGPEQESPNSSVKLAFYSSMQYISDYLNP